MKENILKEIKANIDKDLNSKLMSGKILLDRFLVIDEQSRKTAPYLDFTYSPFYYYLGKIINPKNVLEIGFNLGLLSGSFFLSCSSCENFLGFRDSQDDNNFRLGKRNIKLVFKKNMKLHSGNLYDEEMNFNEKFDLIILNVETNYDKHLEYLEFCFDNLSEDGLDRKSVV